MTLWIISDTHFHHENILTFTGVHGELIRPGFSSVYEMDELMIERWNRVVRPGDHIYHLGDVTMGNDLSVVKRLNGHKRLVLGNHDREDVKKYREVGFEKVFGSRRVDDVLLTHFPVHPDHIGLKNIGNVHGHIHERPSPKGPYYNASVERLNYSPVALEEVRKVLRMTRNCEAVA